VREWKREKGHGKKKVSGREREKEREREEKKDELGKLNQFEKGNLCHTP
jgi:hypothetical protein